MTLKEFHVVFITLSIALAVVFAAWAFGRYWSEAQSIVYLATGVASLLAAGALALYEVGFLRKARRIGLK